jgi:hypothetical protein
VYKEDKHVALSGHGAGGGLRGSTIIPFESVARGIVPSQGWVGSNPSHPNTIRLGGRGSAPRTPPKPPPVF